MKHSLRVKTTIITIISLSFIIFFTWAVNIGGLEKFYMWRKLNEIVRVYDELNEVVMNIEESGENISDDADDKLHSIVRNSSDYYNITIAVIDSITNNAIVTSERDGDELLEKVHDFLFSSNGKNNTEILRQTDNYKIIYKDYDKKAGASLGFMGFCNDNQTMIIMSTPLENMRLNVSAANRFMSYAGIAALVIGIVLIFFLTGRITKPILELAALSKKMGSLDFSCRYEGQTDDEVGILGSNMNAMADKLEETITKLKNANLELEADIKKKEEIDKMRKDFIANVSHELKTPIALIQGYAEGLSDGLCEDEESRKYYTGVIIDEANKMNSMVKQLLTLSSLESGEQDIELEHINLTELIKAVIAKTAILLGDKKADIIFDDSKDMYVWCDEYKIEEVVTNYISNAIHHVNDGGRIEISQIKKDGRLVTYVYNSGSNIPDEDIAHIWDKFYKVDKAHSREYGGTGIGLSIVKAIMDAHGMDCGVENINGGVRFWFELDCKDV